MRFLRRKKADNGTSALPDDHGQGYSREADGKRYRRPSRIDGLRDGLASTMRTFRREPSAPTREGAYTHVDDGAYHGNSVDFASHSEQPSEQRGVHEPLSILRNRPSDPDLFAAREWRSRNQIVYTSDGSAHSMGSEINFEDRQTRRTERQGYTDPGWEQGGLGQEQAFWESGSHTAGPFNTGNDLFEEGYSFGSDQPIMPADWNEGDPHDVTAYSDSDANHAQAAHPTEAKRGGHHDRTESMTSAEWENFRLWRDHLARYRPEQDR